MCAVHLTTLDGQPLDAHAAESRPDEFLARRHVSPVQARVVRTGDVWSITAPGRLLGTVERHRDVFVPYSPQVRAGTSQDALIDALRSVLNA